MLVPKIAKDFVENSLWSTACT